MKHKFYLFIAIFLLIIIAGGSAILFFYYQRQNSPTPTDQIDFFELQTHEYFPDSPNDAKYRIKSVTELDHFYSLYSDAINIDKNLLTDNEIFVEVRTLSSGSVQNKLTNVTFDNNTINFIIETDAPEIGTTDMAFWYFVAIIPKDKLNDLNLSDWVTPKAKE